MAIRGGIIMYPKLAAFALAVTTCASFAQSPPAGYPADYAQTIAAANKEGKVVIYSALDTKADKFKGKVTTYDIEKSGVGFMFVVQDTKFFPGMKDLEKGFGATSYKVYSSTGNMLEKVSSGEHLLGYNVLGSYALVRAKKDPNLGVVLPKDYTLVLSRVIFIGKQAKNPSAAKVWLDYVLSQRGQKMIGGEVELFAIRDDVDAEYTAKKLNQQLGANVKPIPVSSEIVTYLDSKKRLEFLSAWKAALGAGQ